MTSKKSEQATVLEQDEHGIKMMPLNLYHFEDSSCTAFLYKHYKIRLLSK